MGKHEPTLIYADNIGAKGLAEKESIPDHSKHIDVKYHYKKEKVLHDTVVIRYVRTDENVGDVMTKKLGNYKYKKFVKGMGLHQGLCRTVTFGHYHRFRSRYCDALLPLQKDNSAYT